MVDYPRRLVLRMHEERPNARDLGRLQRAQNRIAKECPAEPPLLEAAIHREPAEDHDRDWVRHVASHPAGCAPVQDRAVCQAVERGDGAP